MRGSEMRCFFHLVSADEEILDDTGIEVADLESAKIQAHRALRELRQETEGSADDWVGWRLDIVCPEGTLLYSMDLDISLH